MAHALVHILGSRSGYTTLDATAGLTGGDRAELEVLGFGDATSSEAMARLETHACMVGRRLRSGRFAISRMLPGGTDDKGRPTIEVVSLVLDASGYAAVAGAFARLADDVRFWRLARGAVARGYELPEQAPVESAREPGVLRAFDTWVAARKTGSIGVLAAQDAQSLLAMVALLDGQDLGECRWGVGVVSLSAPVDICTLAPATAAIGSRPVLRAATGESWLSPEMAHVEFHVAQNPLLPQRASLVSAVHIEPALDRDAEATPVAAAPRASASWRPSSPKRNLTMIAAITAAAALAVLVMTTAVYVRTGRAVNVAVADSAAEGEADSGGVSVQSPPTEPSPASSLTYAGVPQVELQVPPAAATEKDAAADEQGAGHARTEPTEAAKPPDPSRSPEQIPKCKDGERWMQLYKDTDGDGCGTEPGESACVEQASKDAAEQLRQRGLATKQGDLCPDNPFRQIPGECGCDWYEQGDDCNKDEDDDDFPDKVDPIDNRVAARDYLAGKSMAAASRAAEAEQRLKVAKEDLAKQLKEAKSDSEKIEMAKTNYCNEVQLARVDAEDALTSLVEATVWCQVGNRAFSKSQISVLKVVAPTDFSDFEEAVSNLARLHYALVDVRPDCGMSNWEEDMIRKLSSASQVWSGPFDDLESRYQVPPACNEALVKWVFGLIKKTRELEELKQDWIANLGQLVDKVRVRKEQGNRGKRPAGSTS